MNREQVIEILEKYGESYWEGAEHAIGWIFPGKFANIAKEIVALHDKDTATYNYGVRHPGWQRTGDEPV